MYQFLECDWDKRYISISSEFWSTKKFYNYTIMIVNFIKIEWSSYKIIKICRCFDHVKNDSFCKISEEKLCTPWNGAIFCINCSFNSLVAKGTTCFELSLSSYILHIGNRHTRLSLSYWSVSMTIILLCYNNVKQLIFFSDCFLRPLIILYFHPSVSNKSVNKEICDLKDCEGKWFWLINYFVEFLVSCFSITYFLLVFLRKHSFSSQFPFCDVTFS